MLPRRITLRSPYLPKQEIPTLTSQPFANLCLNVEHEVIPVHWIRLLPSKLVAQNMNKKLKIIIIHEHIDVSLTLAVVAYLYGYDIHIQSTQELSKLLEVIEVLQIPKIKEKISQILISQIKIFDTFEILQVAHKFSLTDLYQTSIQYLTIGQFEQMKCYKYSLCQCDFELFQKILRKHHTLKMKNKIEGLPRHFISEIIHLYCIRNQIDKNIQNKLYQKYIQSLKPDHETNSLLNANTLQVKNVGHSFYGNRSEMREKDDLSATGLSSIQFASLWKPSLSKRKFSQEIGKTLSEMGLEVISQAKYISSISIQSPNEEQDSHNEDQVENLPIDSCKIDVPTKRQIENIISFDNTQQIKPFEIPKILSQYQQKVTAHNFKIKEIKGRNMNYQKFQKVTEEELSIEEEVLVNQRKENINNDRKTQKTATTYYY